MTNLDLPPHLKNVPSDMHRTTLTLKTTNDDWQNAATHAAQQHLAEHPNQIPHFVPTLDFAAHPPTPLPDDDQIQNIWTGLTQTPLIDSRTDIHSVITMMTANPIPWNPVDASYITLTLRSKIRN